MRLLSILHVRTAHDARSWTAFDIRNNGAAWGSGHIPVWFNKRCVLMCGKDYGLLRDFDSALCHESAMIGFPRALMTIQAQHELMYTLKGIVGEIIHGSAGTGAANWSLLLAAGLHPTNQDVGWNTYTCGAFTRPEKFAPFDLARQADDRLSMIKDELLLMQTDPRYVQELLKSKRVVISNVSSDSQLEVELDHAGSLFLIEYLNRYIIWQTISLRSHELAETFEHYGARCEAGLHMPAEVSGQMEALKVLLNDSFRAASANFESIIHSTRALRSHFYAHQFEGHLYVNEKTQTLDQRKPADRLRWRIKTLREEAAQASNAHQGGYSIMFGKALREEESAQIMDRPTREYLSDMMIIDEIRTLLSSSQRGRCPRKDMSRVELEYKTSHGECCVHDDPNCRPPKLKFDNNWQQRVSVLIHNFVDASWPTGRKDMVWLSKADEARDALARLWKGIGEEYEAAEEAGGEPSACGKHLAASITAFDRDATHQANLRAERLLCRDRSLRIKAAAEDAARKLQEHVSQSEWGLTPTDPLSHKPSKVKSTSAAPNLGCHLEDLSIGATAEPVVEHVIAVAKESLAVFHKMYRANSDCLTGGSLRWQAFVRAMKDAGFSAEKASGSAASFKDGSGRSISFHRPHPNPVLDQIMLYGMAKRLTKWFGFDAERFVLRQKGASGGST